MMILVTGGSKCGKSSYAESLFADLRGVKIYLATMRPFGEEAEAMIERHRKMRAGKGFSTVERYSDIGGADIPDGAGVLLEDMGNLLANEMFSENGLTDPVDKILEGIDKLRQNTSFLVIVSNNIGEDGVNYPCETGLYMEYLSRINNALAAGADRVVECVYGIPIMRKESA